MDAPLESVPRTHRTEPSVGVEDAAAWLGVAPATVRLWCRTGLLSAFRAVNGALLIRRSDLALVAAWHRETVAHEARIAELEFEIGERESLTAERQRQLDALERHVASQRRLLEMGEKLLLAHEPDAVLEILGASLRGIVAYDSMSIHEARDGALGSAMLAVDAYGLIVRDPGTTTDEALAGWVLEHGEAMLVNDTRLDARCAGTKLAANALIVAPLPLDGRAAGVIFVSRLGSHARFTENEFELVERFAAQAAIALQNARSHRAVSDRAERDSLTGLRNHGSFQSDMRELIGRGGPFALLMLDLDAFKAFNDTYGHPAGDALLTAVAQAMGSATRDADGLYRYGGDEFAVLLPGASREPAAVVAERIRAAVARVALAAGGTVTVSFGIACFPEEGRTREELVARADETLYRRKKAARAARNRQP